MKTLNQTFTDEEYEKLLEGKGEKNWHHFILELTEKDKEDDKCEKCGERNDNYIKPPVIPKSLKPFQPF